MMNLMIGKFFDKIVMTPWPFWKILWRFQSKLNSTFIPIAALIIFSTIISTSYAIINHFAEWRGFSAFNANTSLDDSIPFIRTSIIIYGLYYLLFALMISATPRSKKGSIECIYAFQTILTFTTICFLIFIFFPVEITSRKDIDIGEGIIATFYNTLHLADPPYNTWPSLHVNHSVLLSWIFLHWIKSGGGLLRFPEKSNEFMNLMKNKIVPLLIWIICVLVIISTLTTKQHYILDIITGVFLGIFGIYYMKKCIIHTEQNNEEIINYLEN